MKWIHVSIVLSFVWVILALHCLVCGVYNMAAFWSLLAIFSAIYNSVNYAMFLYLKQKNFEIKQNCEKEIKRLKDELKI